MKNDTLDGGDGIDKITGGLGRDSPIGGTQGDSFIFRSVKESLVGINHDTIFGFSHAELDKINLAAIDARIGVAGNQAFSVIGTKPYHHHVGELHYLKKAGFVLVQGDVNGDAVPEFEIRVAGVTSLVANDFVL